ncbi:hypothetical protein HGM15179_014653 [Zosterops borbonicus]|uniref:Uncharacterized protein n=1 Tax=Zosterops borbonicus TaxID=364589 RepID=A0A8K1G677_9PASS|nr:hypothetical protein HGM15179_014653 [Zosterops borbonicus]
MPKIATGMPFQENGGMPKPEIIEDTFSSSKEQQVLLRTCDQDRSSMMCHQAVTKETVTYTYSGEKDSNHGYG